MCDQKDIKDIEQLLGGTLDEHAGNTEISNMLFIDRKLVNVPPNDYLKPRVSDPWQTDNLHDRSKNGVVDNHPKWIVNEKIGEEVLNIYVKRVIVNLNEFLRNTSL